MEKERLEDQLYSLENQLAFNKVREANAAAKRRGPSVFETSQNAYAMYMRNRFVTMNNLEYDDFQNLDPGAVDKRNVRKKGIMGKYGDALQRHQNDLRGPF
eukprot:g2561.t1